MADDLDAQLLAACGQSSAARTIPGRPDPTRAGRVAKIQELLAKGASPNAAEKNGKKSPVLHIAALVGDVDAVRALIAAGADVKAADGEGCGVVHAIAKTEPFEVLKVLLDAGAPIKTRVKHLGRSAMHDWAFGGTGEAIALLIEKGGDPMEEDDEETTPLHMAARCDNVKTTPVLLARGADPDAKDDAGNSPAMVAKKEKSKGVLALFKAHAKAAGATAKPAVAAKKAVKKVAKKR